MIKLTSSSQDAFAALAFLESEYLLFKDTFAFCAIKNITTTSEEANEYDPRYPRQQLWGGTLRAVFVCILPRVWPEPLKALLSVMRRRGPKVLAESP